MPYTDYIDVFNEQRDTDRPLLTLYDGEGIRLFFDLVIAGGELYKQYFKAGTIAMISFNVNQDLQTGTGYYSIKENKVEILDETGAMQGLLQRISYDKVAHPRRGQQPTESKQQRARTSEDDTARVQRYADYLQQTLRQAAESGDQRQEAEVILQYHQAILEVAQAIEPMGADAGKIDLDSFRAKARGLERQRAWFAREPQLLDKQAMATLVAAVTEGLRDIEKLSAEAQEQIQQAIVTRFYDIRHPPSNQ